MKFNPLYEQLFDKARQNFPTEEENNSKGDFDFFKYNPTKENLIAADVLVPDMNPDGSFKVAPSTPYRPEPSVNTFNIKKDYPQLPDVGTPYRALGRFGSGTPGTIGEPSNPLQTPAFLDRGRIRGMMDFVPGGIPAAPGFNYDATLKEYPEEMKGIKRGNMPVYSTPF